MAREAEAGRIARELHDDVGQRIALVSIGLSRLRNEASAPQQVEHITHLQGQLSTVVRSIREVSQRLHPTSLEHVGLSDAIEEQCEEVRRATGLQVYLITDADSRALPPDVSRCLFRVAQEAINNVLRHAEAQSIHLALTRINGTVNLVVSDDGRGLPDLRSAQSRGLGLRPWPSGSGRSGVSSAYMAPRGWARRFASRCRSWSPAMHRPRVILADDHVMVREGLALLLQPEVDLVASVSNGRELLERAKRLQPDVIVTDLTMPELGGLDALRLHRQEGLKGKFVILTVHADAAIAAEAIRAGASGYVVKHAAGEELLQAVRLVDPGQSFLSPLVSGDVVRRLAQRDESRGSPDPATARSAPPPAEGRRVKEIASELGLSVRTVETHKYEIMHQLDVHSPVEMVKFAIRHGIVTA